MAEALLAALIEKGAAQAGEILASDIDAGRLSDLHQRYGIRTTGRNAEAFAHARVVFLAVKPQQVDEVLRDVAPCASAGHLLVSIAAGKRTAHLEALAPGLRVIRVMPNIACLVGAGANAFARGARATVDDADLVRNLLSCCGQAIELPENLFDAVTALSGSGPAFFALLLDGLVDGAVAEGLRREDALALARQTMLGTARLLIDRNLTPAELAAAVTSAKGTTAAGREVLETDVLADILRRTIQAAARRSRELSQA